MSKPSKLLHKELKNNDIETITTSDMALIKKNMRYARTVHPKLPNSIFGQHDSLWMYDIKTIILDNFFIKVNEKPNGWVFNDINFFKPILQSTKYLCSWYMI